MKTQQQIENEARKRFHTVKRAVEEVQARAAKSRTVPAVEAARKSQEKLQLAYAALTADDIAAGNGHLLQAAKIARTALRMR
jgi:hypothetical protein